MRRRRLLALLAAHRRCGACPAGQSDRSATGAAEGEAGHRHPRRRAARFHCRDGDRAGSADGRADVPPERAGRRRDAVRLGRSARLADVDAQHDRVARHGVHQRRWHDPLDRREHGAGEPGGHRQPRAGARDAGAGRGHHGAGWTSGSATRSSSGSSATAPAEGYRLPIAACLSARAPIGSARVSESGAWRSLVSARVLGTRGRGFKSRRPDQSIATGHAARLNQFRRTVP